MSEKGNFLKKIQEQNIEVTIHLSTGYQLKGTILFDDDNSILICHNSKQVLVYKHAIATIVPLESVILD